MPRTDEFAGITLVFGKEEWQLEAAADADRRALGPEELISRLEDLLDQGEITQEELTHYYQEGIIP